MPLCLTDLPDQCKTASSTPAWQLICVDNHTVCILLHDCLSTIIICCLLMYYHSDWREGLADLQQRWSVIFNRDITQLHNYALLQSKRVGSQLCTLLHALLYSIKIIYCIHCKVRTLLERLQLSTFCVLYCSCICSKT